MWCGQVVVVVCVCARSGMGGVGEVEHEVLWRWRSRVEVGLSVVEAWSGGDTLALREGCKWACAVVVLVLLWWEWGGSRERTSETGTQRQGRKHVGDRSPETAKYVNNCGVGRE